MSKQGCVEENKKEQEPIYQWMYGQRYYQQGILDNQYGYLSVNSSFRKDPYLRINSELRMVFSRGVAKFVPRCI